MMRRAIVVGVLATGLSFLAAQSASAQWSLGIGAGATIPTGNFSDFGDGDGASTG